MTIAGKIAVVTGSSRGLGKAIAIGMAREGVNVAVNYRSDKSAAEEVVGEIQKIGCQAIAVQADMTDRTAASQLVETVRQELGEIDILVNNVGDFYFKPLSAMKHDEWHYVLDSNLSSVYYLCKAVLPSMGQRQQGKIVNIGLSPTYLVRGAPNIAAYSIAKTGVLILTRSLAIEVAPYGITVNCVSPGLIDNEHLPPEQEEWMRKRVPMGRLGRPEEIADAVVFLASDKASYISGANLAVGGAWDWEDRPTDHDGDVQELFVGEA